MIELADIPEDAWPTDLTDKDIEAIYWQRVKEGKENKDE